MGSSFTSYDLDDISAAGHAFNSGHVCRAKVAKYGIGGSNCGLNGAHFGCDSDAAITQYFRLKQKESGFALLSIVEKIELFVATPYVRQPQGVTQSKGDYGKKGAAAQQL
ncbi:hypothetical protein [Sagittula sp. SSi028]|uniref:hypothetical protein n=1 Tax=Sagittula sp. SSi028 TaxID=3400636 RepID=UPI003AF7DCDD